MRITKELHFHAAHRLLQHKGKCRWLHGHTYHVAIDVDGDVGPDGFVVDFGDLKTTVGAWVDAHLDHATICSEADVELVRFCEEHSESRVHVLAGPPTAENIAVEILRIARELLPAVRVEAVRVRETDTCCAEAT